MSKKKKTIVAVSGGFDPVHVGHLALFKKAKKLGDRLIVILNTDKFLSGKKSFVFMPFEERKQILESIKYVDKVIKCMDDDETVCKTLKKIKPNIFANGGDRNENNIPERFICQRFRIQMVCGVGGDKVQSSSRLVDKTFKELLHNQL